MITTMGPAKGKVGCPAAWHAHPLTEDTPCWPASSPAAAATRTPAVGESCTSYVAESVCSRPCSLVITNSAAEVLNLKD